MEFNLSLTTDQIVDALIEFKEDMNEEDVFSLIVRLDRKMQCYEFTERLRDHFINEIKKEDGNHIY